MRRQSELVTDLLNRVRNLYDLAGRAVESVRADPHSVRACQEFLQRCERFAANVRSIEDLAGGIRQSDIPPKRLATVIKELSKLRVTMVLVVTESIKAHSVVSHDALSLERAEGSLGLGLSVAKGT